MEQLKMNLNVWELTMCLPSEAPREDESTVGFKTGYPARAKPQISSKEKSCERQFRIESAF